jgi:hypothetical protein
MFLAPEIPFQIHLPHNGVTVGPPYAYIAGKPGAVCLAYNAGEPGRGRKQSAMQCAREEQNLRDRKC